MGIESILVLIILVLLVIFLARCASLTVPASFVKRHWVAVSVVAALGVGTAISTQNARQLDADRRQAQADQVKFNLGVCERGNILRAESNGRVEQVAKLRKVVLTNVTIAAETDPSEAARERWREQRDLLKTLTFDKSKLVDCGALVKEQTPKR